MQNLQILLICEEILDLHDKRIGRIFLIKLFVVRDEDSVDEARYCGRALYGVHVW